MSDFLTADDFLIYVADTQAIAREMVPAWVRDHLRPTSQGTLLDTAGNVVGVTVAWRQVESGHLQGIHAPRVHVWATGYPTMAQRDMLYPVTSGYLSHVEWI